MRLLWLRLDAAGAARLGPMPVRAMHYQGPIEAESYRRRARGEEPPAAHPTVASNGVRTLRLEPGQQADILGAPARRLTFVVSGQLVVTDDSGQELALERGTLLYTEGSAGQQGAIRPRGSCRLLQVEVTGSWPEADGDVLDLADAEAAPVTAPNLQRLHRGADERAYFRSFEKLFAGPAGQWSATRAVSGFRLITLADGTFIDWHPEVINQLVMVLAGEIALESSGDRRNEPFRAGDICLAEDRTGIGHIDRIRGLTALWLLVMEDADLW